MIKAGRALTAGRVAERLICLAKSESVTLLSTSPKISAFPMRRSEFSACSGKFLKTV
jgi:hypothetical protein